MTKKITDGTMSVWDAYAQRWSRLDKSDLVRLNKDTPLRLVTADRYDVDDLILAGWTRDDVDGYHWHDYFKSDGTYLGPDVHGIEPLFFRK